MRVREAHDEPRPILIVAIHLVLAQREAVQLQFVIVLLLEYQLHHIAHNVLDLVVFALQNTIPLELNSSRVDIHTNLVDEPFVSKGVVQEFLSQIETSTNISASFALL